MNRLLTFVLAALLCAFIVLASGTALAAALRADNDGVPDASDNCPSA